MERIQRRGGAVDDQTFRTLGGIVGPPRDPDDRLVRVPGFPDENVIEEITTHVAPAGAISGDESPVEELCCITAIVNSMRHERNEIDGMMENPGVMLACRASLLLLTERTVLDSAALRQDDQAGAFPLLHSFRQALSMLGDYGRDSVVEIEGDEEMRR